CPARAPAPAGPARVRGACRALARPVYLEIPRDRVAAECAAVGPDPVLPVDQNALAACADEVLDRLATARAPLLMVCVEVRRYGLEAKVAELACRLGIALVRTFMGRGVLSRPDVRVSGPYRGAAGGPAVGRRVESSDALFLAGAILSDTNFGVSERQIDLRKAIHAFDRQVTLGYHVYPEIPIGDLIEALLARVPTARPRVCAPCLPSEPHELVADDAPIAPMDIARAVNDLMDRRTSMPIAADMGDCLFTAMDIANTELVAPGYYAGMGFGVPAGIGMQVASKRRALILVGDGAFQMTG